MEFDFKNNVKVVVNFEVGEEVLVKDYGPKLNGKHIIVDFKTNFGGCDSGILIKLRDFDSWLDLGWINKIPETF